MGWLRNLFARRPRPAPAGRRATRAPAPSTGRPAAPVPTFSQLVALAAPPVLPPCPATTIEAAAARVLAHFDANRPGPGSFPNMAARIMDILAVPEPDFNRLVQAVGQDVAITAKLLQVANSALNARGEEVQTVRAAVVKLGVREVGQLAIGLAGRSLFETESRAEYSLFPEIWDRLFHEAMTAAFSSGALALTARVGRSDSAFLAGLLHDIGKPIALRSLASLLIDGQLGAAILEGAVDAVLDRVHVAVGTILTSEWALPEYLRAAAARHHEPEIDAEPGLDDLHIVRVVDGLKALREDAITDAQRVVLRDGAARLGLEPRMLRVCATEHADLARRVSEIFGIADPMARAPRARQAAS